MLAILRKYIFLIAPTVKKNCDLRVREPVTSPGAVISVNSDWNKADAFLAQQYISSDDRAPVSSVKTYYDNLQFLYYYTRSIVFKIDDLKANCLLYKPDTVCIVETWLGSDVMDSEICIPDYELTRLDRDRHGGGVIIYVADHLPFTVIFSLPSVFSNFCFIPFWSICSVCFV